MTRDTWTDKFQPSSKKIGSRYQRDIPNARKAVFDYLLKIVKKWSPADVLDEFKHLFIHHINTSNSVILPALYEIVFANKEADFRNTLKRSCYILINNWELARQHDAIRDLIALFEDPILRRPTQSPTLRRLRGWLRHFVESQDFEEIRLFATRHQEMAEEHWSRRYTSYLLVPQYANLENSTEQREAARTLSYQLKEKFKMDLAFYTVLAEQTSHKSPKDVINPTVLGDESLRMIKRIIAKRGTFSYENLANIFRHQTDQINYYDFKQALKEYLLYSLSNNDFAQGLEISITEKLGSLYKSYEESLVNDALLLRTCNRIIECLTTEDHKTPSALFSRLMSQGNPLTLVILLLKIVLICRHVRTHLESRIADLIRYYEQFDMESCQWVISFFEIFKITMTIHADNIEYNLVRVMNEKDAPKNGKPDSLESYRIFSRTRDHDTQVQAAQPEESSQTYSSNSLMKLEKQEDPEARL
ncbi:MAG: hypothetical protein F6K30_01135 [Cyanothece sp. SIO2G6]|nr:hypothetical protein [Cyanothece sp. SIO2G6]